jgi:hypothetical protein
MLRPAFGITLILLVAITFAIQPVAALKVTNPKIMADVTPGSTLKFPMAVSIAAGEPASDYAVEVLGFGQEGEGSYTPLTAAADTGPYSARTFVTVDFPLVHLEPGQGKAFNAIISVPQDVGDGGRYALIHIHPTYAAGTGQAAISTAMIVPVMLTMKGTTLTHTGAITNLEVGEAMTDTPLTIQTTLKNIGNHHYYGAFVNVGVTDSTGKEVATASTTPSIFALIPGNEMIIKTSIASLPAGTYTVNSEAKFGTTLLDTKTASFTVAEPGAAAPTPAVSEAPTQVVTEAPTQAMSVAPTAPMTVVTTEESPVMPGATATRAPLSAITIMLALAAVSGILVLRRRN